MAKTNTFYGAIMSFGTVSIYYPVNAAYPDFGGFVFQQMIEDGSKTNDDYTLIVYAVNTDGTVLNNQAPLPLTASTLQSVIAKKNVQFANMKLDLTGLAGLYPPGVNSDLTIYPYKYFKATGYISYITETMGAIAPLTPIKRTLNPSPPY